MIDLLSKIVLTIAGFELIILSIILLTQSTKNQYNRPLLVAFLLTKAFLMIRWFLFSYKILTYNGSIYYYHISASAFFLLAPLLYFYIRSLCYKDFKFKISSLFHFILFIFIIIYKIISVKLLFIESIDTETMYYKFFLVYHNNVFWTLNFIQILFYIILMLKTLFSYQRKVNNIYSSIEKINLKWVMSLLSVIILHWFFVTTRATLSILNITSGNILGIIDLFSITIFLVFVTILVFKGLNQIKNFAGITEKKEQIKNLILSENEIVKYKIEIIDFMNTQKPYLIPLLTIEKLSEKLSIQPWLLSYVINRAFNQNFFNFVNNYRVEEVKKKLKDPENKNKTILQILYEAGFNSKSTFNSVFKKFTGTTPKQFRNIQQI